jgi:hypothetical protein
VEQFNKNDWQSPQRGRPGRPGANASKAIMLFQQPPFPNILQNPHLLDGDFVEFPQSRGLWNTVVDHDGDVASGVCSSEPYCFGAKANRMGALHKLLDTYLEGVESGLSPNCGEFAIVEIRVVDLLPDADEFKSVSIPKPICDEEIAILCL